MTEVVVVVGGGGTNNSVSKKRSRGMVVQGAAAGGEGAASIEGGGGGGGGGDDHALHLWTERERRKKMKDMFSDLHHLLPHIPDKADKSTIIDEAVSYIQNLQVILEEFQRLKLERIQNGYSSSLMSMGLGQNLSTNHVQQQTWESSHSVTTHDHGLDLMGAPPLSPPVFETWSWPNVVLNVCGEQGQFSVCALKKPNLSSSICFLFEKHNLDVVYCNLMSNQTWCIYMIQAQVRKEGSSTSTDHDDDHRHRHRHHHLGYDHGFPAAVEIFKRAAADMSYWVSNST